MSNISLRRRLGALVLVPVVLLMSACGGKVGVTIHEEETVDMSFLLWGSEMTQESCDEIATQNSTEYEMTSTFTEHEGQPACEAVATGMPLAEFNGDGSFMQITHEDGLYVADIDMTLITQQRDYYERTRGQEQSDPELSLTLTFPGKVTEASGDAEISGSSVTWNLMEESGTLHAEGKDSAGLPLVWILGIAAGLLVVAGAVVTLVLVTRKRKAGTPAYPAHGYGSVQQDQAPQSYSPPQYAQPSQPGQAPQGCQAPQGYGPAPQSYPPAQPGETPPGDGQY